MLLSHIPSFVVLPFLPLFLLLFQNAVPASITAIQHNPNSSIINSSNMKPLSSHFTPFRNQCPQQISVKSPFEFLVRFVVN